MTNKGKTTSYLQMKKHCCKKIFDLFNNINKIKYMLYTSLTDKLLNLLSILFCNYLSIKLQQTHSIDKT